MAIYIFATIVMKRGREKGGLKLIRAVERGTEASQPGANTYLLHRTLDKKTNKVTRKLFIYEVYRDKPALDAHLASKGWKAMKEHWKTYFEGSYKYPRYFNAVRLAGFTRPGAIPVARSRKG
jgi:quinol monooxygenase YgiN